MAVINSSHLASMSIIMYSVCGQCTAVSGVMCVSQWRHGHQSMHSCLWCDVCVTVETWPPVNAQLSLV